MTAGTLKIGFVGLGEQGEPIARRVATSFDGLQVYARRPEPLEWFRVHGSKVAASVAAMAADVDVLQLCVRDDGDVAVVVDEALPNLAPGSVILLHSTIAPQTCRELAARARGVGVGVVDAPVSGGRAKALDGELTVFAGGSNDDVAVVTPILDTVASHVVRTGPVGTGASLKLLNNLMFAVQVAHVSRLRELFPALGLDESTAFGAIATSSGSSQMLEAFVANGADQLYYTHEKGYDYGVEVLAKDVRLALEMLRESCPGPDFPVELADAADAALRALRR